MIFMSWKLIKNPYFSFKVYDSSQELCDDLQTRVYVCLEKDMSGSEWFAVSFAHILIVLTLIAYFCVQELRCLQVSMV